MTGAFSSRRIAARNEWRLLRRESSFWVVVALLIVSVGYAWSNGATFRNQRALEVEQTNAEARAHLESEREAALAGAPDEFSARVRQARTVALAPPGPLADFSIGQSELYPYHAEISLFRRHDDLFRKYQLQSPLTLHSGRFDLSFVVIYLLPLLLIVLSYNLLSSEREQGTLALTLTQPISTRSLLLAKLLPRAVAVLLVFSLLVALAFLANGELSSERVVRAGLWLVSAVAYAGFWVALIAAVNALGRTSETNAVLLACFWLLFVVVVPAVLNVVLQTAVPSPSRLAYVSEMRAATADAARASSDLLANYYEDHPELAAEDMQSGFLPAFFAQQREIERRVTPILAEFEQSLAQQQRFVRVSSLLSPAVLVQEVFNQIAGTGLNRQSRFVDSARTYLTAWHEQLSAKVFTDAELEASDYGSLPVFSFDEEPLRTTGLDVLLSALVLLLPAGLLLAWASRRVERFPVAA